MCVCVSTFSSIDRLAYLAAFSLFAILTELEVIIFLFNEGSSLIDLSYLWRVVVNGLVLEKLNLIHHVVVATHWVTVSYPATFLVLLWIKQLVDVVANYWRGVDGGHWRSVRRSATRAWIREDGISPSRKPFIGCLVDTEVSQLDHSQETKWSECDFMICYLQDRKYEEYCCDQDDNAWSNKGNWRVHRLW